MAEIKDSGSRREFETGAVRDDNGSKGRCDLLPLSVVSSYLALARYPELPEIEMSVLDVIERAIKAKTLTTAKLLLFTAVDVFTKVDVEAIESTRGMVNAAEGEERWCPLNDPCTVVLEVSKHFQEGAGKYGENNWKKGLPVHCYIDSAIRHYIKYIRGDRDERHDRAFVWNIFCCIWTLENKPELNDLFTLTDDMGEEKWLK